ncbi:MTA/SAH nucleosidase [Propionimicrobium lymphophilum ACS-093-V-SCH5]|uniref:adenosylhomocysteine nucleosidase n=1 Tax=Propionimicrobium lymphophilum ACS-093-V-SCH5 TaxID=883161 RepID=S2VWV3_9ACTN|nr:5'-methylthioadenosine/S-adenosylhomocysteine nucleosidase [Propionimicrobium lymphophilum]EPD31983.1 MTA/SAH nucleosidase [Propionimicrobium lymphophilum ACS-093-V-SCH5]
MPKDIDLCISPLPTPKRILALFTAAMADEAVPLADLAGETGQPVNTGASGYLQLYQIGNEVIGLLRTGIGLVNAASALSAALLYVTPSYIFSCGSAGGLDANSHIGDVSAGASCVFSSADARVFGYKLGQVPGMPESYLADPDLLTRFEQLSKKLKKTNLRSGLFLSADKFASVENALELRKNFPEAITVDMESTALAQVAYGANIPFLALRGISDLCGPTGHKDNEEHAGDVSRLSFLTAMTLIGLRDPEEFDV